MRVLHADTKGIAGGSAFTAEDCEAKNGDDFWPNEDHFL